MVGNPEAGRWVENAITGGQITLVMKPDNEFDILIADASGQIVSATGDGAIVAVVGLTATAIAKIAIYPRAMETYTFVQSVTGPEVIWTNAKFDAPIVSASAFRASCSFLNLP